MRVKIKRLNDDAVIPQFKTSGAAGFDLVVTDDALLLPATITYSVSDDVILDHVDFNAVVLGTGLAFEIPQGYELEIRSRSGMAFKYDVLAYNGTIDEDYRGEVKIKLWNLGDMPFFVAKGERVAQGIIKRIEQVDFIESDSLSETDRGTDGFGSTGRA